MTKDIIYRVQNDTGPDEEFIITRGDDNSIVDLTSSTVVLAIRSRTSGSITNTGHQVCTLTNPTKGVCTYVFQIGDLPDAGGDYDCDLQITDNAGKIATYYNRILIRTRPEIAT